MKSIKISDRFLVRCDIGEEVISTLRGFVDGAKIESGTILGIGAVKQVVLGYFDTETREYARKEFDGVYELLSLSGNIAKKDDETILHCHAVISDSHFNVFGGHLFSAEIAVTGEFYVDPGGITARRGPDSRTGLNLLDI